jgi:archaemetzincin
MKPVRLVPVEDASPRFVDAARAAIERTYRTRVDLFKVPRVPRGSSVPRRQGLPEEPRNRGTEERFPVDVAAAYHSERGQYHSTAILEQLARVEDRGELLVAVAPFDLYIPILTFVFGEAQLGGRCAVVSYFRMTQEFYGLPRDERLTASRIAKTAVHELGHVFGLTHCDDYECVMAPSHSVEWLDLKSPAICESCRDSLQLSMHFTTANLR